MRSYSAFKHRSSLEVSVQKRKKERRRNFDRLHCNSSSRKAGVAVKIKRSLQHVAVRGGGGGEESTESRMACQRQSTMHLGFHIMRRLRVMDSWRRAEAKLFGLGVCTFENVISEGPSMRGNESSRWPTARRTARPKNASSPPELS